MKTHSHHIHYLFLRELETGQLAWFIENGEGHEKDTGIHGRTVSTAIRAAYMEWADQAFRPLHCGFRYDAEQRDEHGTNALFCEMIESYSMNNLEGEFFDGYCGHRCYVDAASEEALELWRRLKDENRA